MNIHLMSLRLHDAAEAALISYWADSPTLQDMKRKTLRKNMIAALSRCDIDQIGYADKLLEERIRVAIDEGGARAVMEALFNFGEE